VVTQVPQDALARALLHDVARAREPGYAEAEGVEVHFARGEERDKWAGDAQAEGGLIEESAPLLDFDGLGGLWGVGCVHACARW